MDTGVVDIDIKTHRLLLIQKYRVVDEHVTWLNDKELMKWSEQRYMEHDYLSQREFLKVAEAVGNPLVWDIRVGAGEISIGSLHAYCDGRHKRVDMGIMIGPQFHGQGYGAEAWSAVFSYLGAKRGFRKFEAGTVDGNTPMIKLLMRLGWTPEGRRENHFIIDGEPRGLVQFGKVWS
jgi:ribosomal-protein-alanine N-acetyltransferase